MFDPRTEVATTNYRRAISKPRVIRAPKTFPRAHTPSPEARRLTNLTRTGRLCRVEGCIQYALHVGGPCNQHKHFA